MPEDEIYFTKRIAKMGDDLLVIIVPTSEKHMFEHEDLVKVTLLRKLEKKEADKHETGSNNTNQADSGTNRS